MFNLAANNKKQTLLLLSTVLLGAMSPQSTGRQSTGQTSGCASPIFFGGQVSGTVIACINGVSAPRLAKAISDQLIRARLNPAQERASLKGLNKGFSGKTIPVSPELASISQKEDYLISIVMRLLQMYSQPQKSAEVIEDDLAKQKSRLLPNASISLCGCHGRIDSGDYGEKRPNNICLSGFEKTAACVMHVGTNICRGTLIDRISGEPGYTPWERACAALEDK